MSNYFYPGQQVVLKEIHRRGRPADEVFTVKKVYSVNMDVYTSDGQTLRGKPRMFEVSTLPDNGQAEKTIYGALAQNAESELARERFVTGQVVTVTAEGRGRKWNYPDEQKFVVIKVGADRVNIAKLGGEEGRYWRMSRGLLVKVEV